MPGRPLRLSILGATCSSSNSNSLARSARSIYRCCNPLKIFGMSSRDLRSNFIFEMLTSPICICTFCTTRIVFFLRQNITLWSTLTYSMNVPHHTVNGEQNCEPDEEYFITSNRQDLGAKIPGKIPSLPHTSAKHCHSSYTSRQSSCRQNSTKLAPLRGNRGSRLGSRPNTIYPDQYSLDEPTFLATGVFLGYKISDFGYGTTFPSIRAAVRAREKHAEIIALEQSMIDH